jgi:hypothetical protein
LPDDAKFCPQCGQKRPASAAADADRERLRKRPQPEPEEPLWQGGFSGRSMIGTWLTVAVLSFLLWTLVQAAPDHELAIFLVPALAALWGLPLLQLGYDKLVSHHRLTTQRLTHRHGILQQQIRRLELIDIDDVTVRQSILQRLVNAGTIELQSSDVTDPLLVMHGVAPVREVSLMIDDARRAERQRRGLFIESV